MRGVTEPRIFTPPLRELTPETSLGFAAIQFARDVMGKELYPWQEWLLIHMLEIVDVPVSPEFPNGWRFRFRIVLNFVSRQNGKTIISEVIAEFFLLVLGVEIVVGTSLSLDKAQEVWEGVVDDITADPELASEIDGSPRRTNGSFKLCLKGNRKYKVAAMGRRAGRGDSVDLGLLDELREHRDWDTWDAMVNATNAKPNGMLACFSNAGTVDSIVLRALRGKALASLGIANPDEGYAGGNVESDDIAIFEWSAPDGASKDDEEALAQANPALGYGRLTMRALQTSAATSEDVKFRTECMCQIVDARVDPPFDEGAWEGGIDEHSRFAKDAEVALAVDVSTDRRRAAIAGAGLRPDRQYHVEVMAYRTGTAWVHDWLVRYVEKYGPCQVAIQSRGAPASSMVGSLMDIDGVDVIEWQGQSVAAWTGRFFDAVNASAPSSDSDAVRVMHVPQPALDEAAQVAAVKSLGDAAKALNRKDSPKDICTLVACAAAFGLVTENDHIKRTTYESAYANRDFGLVTI